MKFSRVNSTRYHGWTVDQLSTLGTRHLLALLKASRNVITCGIDFCRCDAVNEVDREHNQNQFELGVRAKQILATRPHLDRNARTRTARNFGGREKKVMRY